MKGGLIWLDFKERVQYVNHLIMEEEMPNGHIPVNASDLPIDVPALEEDGVYDVVLKRVILNPTAAKNGLPFCKIQTEVTTGKFETAFLPLNYLPLPVPGDSYQAVKQSVPFGRFCRAFGIKTEVPEVDLLDAESINAFQDWISQYYEATGKVTIRNQEYPPGSGKMNSGINDFLF